MKKLLVSSALLSAVLISAQIDFSSTRFGITAGGTYSRVSNAHNPSGPRLSAYGGVLALIPVDNNDQFYIQPQVEYFGAGESVFRFILKDFSPKQNQNFLVWLDQDSVF